MRKFKPVDPKPDFPMLERELVQWWYKSGLVKKYLLKNKKAKKRFSFMDGPITANNPMGVHHAWGRTYKDLWQKYKNMRGFSQRFQNGFDCQGLWVEVEVEKELGFRSKKDIEKFGIAKFVSLCKERVNKYSKIQTQQSKRLGYFMDWEDSYFTMSDENNYMIWYFLKKCWENGWLYKGKDSVPWCPRCSTAISQHEMLTEDYKEVTHESIYLKLPIKTKGWENHSFLVWTTTPWTIPGNVALMVDQKKDYLLVKINDEWLIFLKNRAEALGISLDKDKVKRIKGSELVGLEYEAPFDHLPRVKMALQGYKHKVVQSDPLILEVQEDEGTGIVHIAPGAGAEDYQLAKKEKLLLIDLIDEQAFYLDNMAEFSGQNAKKHPELILNYLKTKNKGKFFYKTEKIKHRYPACWRCKHELVWRAVDEWYISMDKKDPLDPQGLSLRQKMISVAQKIKWLPQFGLDRELDWLKNMHDWLISKKRYWGLALPIWECSAGHFEVIGSYEELKKRAVAGWKEFLGQSPHRPWIDKVKIKCHKCGKLAFRILDVGNPWLDAGIVNFSTLIDPQTKKISYTSDKKYFKQWFPADFITESFPGQFKNWFYSQIAMSTVLENKPPFKRVLGFATLFGEDGRPMHKSWGNMVEFNEGADKIGVDVMRWMYLTHDPKNNLLFGFKIADETRRKFHLTLWNIYNFFITYANLNDWQPQNKPEKLSILDQWLLTKLTILIQEVTSFMDAFDPFHASLSLEQFIQDLSTWYIRRSRERVSPVSENKEDIGTCLGVLHQTLVVFTKLLAPFNPFCSELIYKNLTGEVSVHLASWPESKQIKTEGLIKLPQEMEVVRELCEMGHAKRKELKIKIRQPLAEFRIQNSSRRNSRGSSTETSGKFRIIKNNKALIQLIKDELNIKEVVFKEGKEAKVDFDTKLTQKLIKEGQARDLIRSIQAARKKTRCKLTQQVIVEAPSWPKEYELDIKKKALVKELRTGNELKIITQ